MRLLHILIFLFISGVVLAQPTPDANTRLFGQKGSDLIPVTIGQILGLGTGISSVTTNSTLSGAGTMASPLGIAQQGAVSGNILGWNGSTWGPASGNIIVENPTFFAATTGASTANGINFFASGPATSGTTDGPYMIMRGNNFSTFSGQRGSIFFVAGLPSGVRAPGEGNVQFNSPVGEVTLIGGNGIYFSVGSVGESARFLPSGSIAFPKYGLGTYTGTPSRWLAVQSDGVMIERDARQMSQETGNWGQLWQHTALPNFGAAGNILGWTYVQGSGTVNDAPTGGGATTQWYSYTVVLGSDFSSVDYAMQVAIPRTPANGVPPAQYIRFRELGVWGSWTKQAAGRADIASTIEQNGATTGQTLRWNGTTWGPTTGFSVSATGEITSMPLAGTAGSGDRLVFTDETGKLYRSVISSVLQTVSTSAEFTGTGVAGSPVNLFKPTGNKKNMVWDQSANRWIASTQPPVIISVLPFDHATSCVVGIRSQGFFRVPQEFDGKYLNKFTANLLGGQVGGFMGIQIKRYRAGSAVVNIGFTNIAAGVNQFTSAWTSTANDTAKQLQTGDLLQVEITSLSGVTTPGLGLNIFYHLFNNWDEI